MLPMNVCADSNYLATPYCRNVVSKVFVKRPYIADPNVADYIYEAPSYYCNLHNLDVTKYPINPSTTIDPNFNWDGSNGNPDEGGTTPANPGNENGNNGNGNGNGNGNQDDGSKPPDWLNFFD